MFAESACVKEKFQNIEVLCVTDYKEVPARRLQIGEKVSGYRRGTSVAYAPFYVKQICPGYVKLAPQSQDDYEEIIDSDAVFLIEMTCEEIKAKYFDRAKEVYRSIQNKLVIDQLGCHGMWNAWYSPNPYDLAKACAKYKIKVVGHCTDITPKYAMFTGDLLDVGICVECEDGDRFWCHARSSDLLSMIENFKELRDENNA